MKKITALFLSLVLMFALVACGNQNSDAGTSSDTEEQSVVVDTQAAESAQDTETEDDSVDSVTEEGTAGDETDNDAEQSGVTGTVHTNEFDLENGTVLLNNGIEMPVLGIGTFTLTSEQASDSVYWAMESGFRLIDTASAYGNEDGVGEGIQRAIDAGIIDREDIFVTTKL